MQVITLTLCSVCAYMYVGQFVHHCCDELRAFQSALEAGEQQAYSQHFTEPVKKKRSKDPLHCPTGTAVCSYGLNFDYKSK